MSSLSHDLIDRIIEGTIARVSEALRDQLGRLEIPTGPGRTPMPLARAAHGMRSATGQADTLRVLLAAASSLGARAALFVVRPGRLEGWNGVGFEDDPGLSSGVRGLGISASEAAVRRALESGSPVAAATGSDLPVPDFGQAIRGEALLMPLTVHGKIAGLLYIDPASADVPLDTAGLETLVELAGLAIERNVSARHAHGEAAHVPPADEATGTPAARPEAVAPAPPEPSDEPPAPSPVETVAMPAADAAVPESDPEGADAVRFARLLMDEICLYNADKVEEGRRARDLAVRLDEEITRARAMYSERVSAEVRARGDWFEQAMVAVLAGGDAEALGTPVKSSS